MKRYEFFLGHGEIVTGEAIGGEWVRYSDHVEVMKRIAGDGAQQEPVAWLFDNEDDGKHWYDTPQPMGRPVYAAPAPASPAALPECDTCNGFVHVHDATGEYRGECPHCAPSASAQQAEPTRIHTNTNREFSMEHRQFSYEGNGYIQDNNFDFDAGLKISGDFVNDDKDNYCRMIVAALNAAPAPSASPICTCPSGDGSLRHPCPSHPSASPEPYNAYQRDWEKVVRWVKVQSETFPELASMSPEGAISWLVVELAARHEKFAEPSASPAALTDEHYEEVKATLQGAHNIMENLSKMERNVGPLGSHGRGYTHKITAALRHLDALWADAQRLAASPADQAGWQPIETAPKDGTVIDLWVGGDHRRTSCYWGLPHHCCGEMGSYCDSEWHDLVEGWVDDLNEPLGVFNVPTHWMPLPTAPSMSTTPPAAESQD